MFSTEATCRESILLSWSATLMLPEIKNKQPPYPTHTLWIPPKIGSLSKKVFHCSDAYPSLTLSQALLDAALLSWGKPKHPETRCSATGIKQRPWISQSPVPFGNASCNRLQTLIEGSPELETFSTCLSLLESLMSPNASATTVWAGGEVVRRGSFFPLLTGSLCWQWEPGKEPWSAADFGV